MKSCYKWMETCSKFFVAFESLSLGFLCTIREAWRREGCEGTL